ncbi:hypothetical protein H0E87_026197 [Populus deltoides]|uniref:Uncharacterized protein n=1 Tax=Populus deltoides TaxID=3696 RepID=A0A8T2X1W9_POPDE|nr:hypothetical protein H0E87_026197 [Populus deltoides]
MVVYECLFLEVSVLLFVVFGINCWCLNGSRLLEAGTLDTSNGYCGQKFMSVEFFDKSQPIRYAYGEPKVMPGVPPEGNITKEARAADYDIVEVANERITHPISDLAAQAGRKRRVDNSSVDNSVDSQPGKSQSNRKRRQEEIAGANLSEDAINNSITWTRDAVCKDRDAAEDADVLIINKIIEVSEVTCEITDAAFANQEKPTPLQNSEKTSNPNTGTGRQVSEVLKEHCGGNVGNGSK